MAAYRCYFIGHDGHIHDVATIFADSDAEAIDRARQLLERTDYPAFEIWQERRRIIPADDLSAQRASCAPC
jgi:hypothetical protein